MPENVKKPINISALFIVFLILSATFTILAYGYGRVKQAKDDDDFYLNPTNFERMGEQMGYSMIKLNIFKSTQSYVPASNYSANFTQLDNTTNNSTGNISL